MTVNVNTSTAEPEPPVPVFFEARLLQVASSSEMQEVDPNTGELSSGSGVFRRVFDGGGGSEASFFNPDNEVQYSTEVINLTDDGSDLVVYADNPNYFSTGKMSRVIEVEPQLPSGFEIVKITIADLPAGFEIANSTAGAGGASVDNPPTTSTGNSQIIINYDVPTLQSFTMGITIDAEFNQALYDILNPDDAGFTPAETVLAIEEEQKVEVKEVFGPNDLNYIDGENDLVWFWRMSQITIEFYKRRR